MADDPLHAGRPRAVTVPGRKAPVQPVDDPDDADRYTHRDCLTNGVRLHFVEEGGGPLVLLLHGFPYLWYTWRRQIRPLAAAGFRVVAPDLRGFGRSDCPGDPRAYAMLQTVGDLVGLLGALGERRAILVGHDLGAWVARAAAEVRPDLFSALVMLNTPVGPREAQPPGETWRAIEARTGKQLYHAWFQAPGVADAAMNADIRRTLRSIHFSVSGSARGAQRWRPLLAPGETILDTVSDPQELPPWMSARALEYYTAEYARNGFTGPLGHYRARDLNWEQTAFLAGRVVRQPSLFIGGAEDPARELFMPQYEALEKHLPGLRGKCLLPDVGHDAAEEQPDMITEMLREFLSAPGS